MHVPMTALLVFLQPILVQLAHAQQDQAQAHERQLTEQIREESHEGRVAELEAELMRARTTAEGRKKEAELERARAEEAEARSVVVQRARRNSFVKGLMSVSRGSRQHNVKHHRGLQQDGRFIRAMLGARAINAPASVRKVAKETRRKKPFARRAARIVST